MKLIFERSAEGRGTAYFPGSDVPVIELNAPLRQAPLNLPEVPEVEVDRHYTELANHSRGVNGGFYPLGSCTMKYNPAMNESIAGQKGFTEIHPLQPEETVKGAEAVFKETEALLSAITGMDAFTLQPAAGAHGEFTGLLVIKAYHLSRSDTARTKIIVPDSAHGTNPASASMAGFEVVNIPSNDRGCVDLDALRSAVGHDTAGLMLTNPNTVGLFDPNILEITKIVHEAGGLCYYDGANLNAVMGIVRPGDMGFDVMHVNLHKTFSTPHGGGGPGSGPAGCKAFLAEFLPGKPEASVSVGNVRSFAGNFLVIVRALAYMKFLGREGIPATAENAVLNANYMMEALKDLYPVAYEGPCMHEFVMTLEKMKNETHVSALDVAKALLDYGMHPPTMYFPLIVHEALMAEPTETESKERLDEAIETFRKVYDEAVSDPGSMHDRPRNTSIRRPDEVAAARNPVVRYKKSAD